MGLMQPACCGDLMVSFSSIIIHMPLFVGGGDGAVLLVESRAVRKGRWRVVAD